MTDLHKAAIAALEAALSGRPDPDLLLRDAYARQRGENLDGSPRRETVAEPWPKTEDGLCDMSLGTMLRFTRLQALDVAERAAFERLWPSTVPTAWTNRDRLRAEAAQEASAAIRALKDKEPSDE
jgi:hypothetical protein